MHLETQRLRIAPLSPEMAEAVYRNSQDADQRRFLPDEVFETLEEARAAAASLADCLKRGTGPQVYAATLKTGEIIGYVEASPMQDGAWEIGYHIAGPFTRRGYATEALAVFLPAVAKQLGQECLWGICVAENAASIRVMEKCGFSLTFAGTGAYQGAMREIRRYCWQLQTAAME